MQEYLQALFVILVLATVVFALAKTPACTVATIPVDFIRRRNLWFGITLVAFLAHNFWIYIIAVAALLLNAIRKEPNKQAMFFFLLFAVPVIPGNIPGLGIFQTLFTIHYVRLLTLAVLLPAFLSILKQPDMGRFGNSWPDKLIACYMILSSLLMLDASTLSNWLRDGVFNIFVDIFLPYYVASRSLKNLQRFRDALMGFAIATLVLSATAVFEFIKHWLLYRPLTNLLGDEWRNILYATRNGNLRAQATSGHPIALGYVIAVSAGLFPYLKITLGNTRTWRLGLALLMMGLIAPLSRGPWIGAAAMLLIFVATSPYPGKGVMKLLLFGIMAFPLLLITPAGDQVIALLPFVGSVETENIVYRQRLIEVSIQVIKQYPFFGSFNYLESPEMQVMKEGGIIDVVNTYLGVCLSYGLVGLSLFSSFFISVGIGIFNSMRSLPERNSELYLLGQVLFATLIGIMVIIFTVSSVTIIPVVYWSVAGLGVAYTRMLTMTKTDNLALENPIFDQFQPAMRRR